MGKMPTVQCRSCGKEFSALRADCPYCGQRRAIGDSGKPSVKPVRVKKTGDGGKQTRSNWQLIVGLLLIATGILAVMVLFLSGKTGRFSISARPTPVPTTEIRKVEAKPTPTPSPTQTVNQIKVFWLTYETTDFTMYVGDDPVTVSARAYPNDKLKDARFTWSVSDATKVRLKPSEDTQSCEITALESAGGPIKLTVRCFGAETEVTLRVWAIRD